MATINGVQATRDELKAAVVVREARDCWQVVSELGVVAVRTTLASAIQRAKLVVDELDSDDLEMFGAANADRRILINFYGDDDDEFWTVTEKVKS